MKPSPYFELRAAVVETFYETLLSERYTIGQAAGRCLVEFTRETKSGGRDALVALSVLLARVARHDPAVLARCRSEIAALEALAKQPACWRGLSRLAKERMQEDIRFALEKRRGWRNQTMSFPC